MDQGSEDNHYQSFTFFSSVMKPVKGEKYSTVVLFFYVVETYCTFLLLIQFF